MNAGCDVYSRFDAVGTLVCVGVVCSGIFWFSCVQCVLLVDWRCFANVLWCCEFAIAPTLFRVGVSVWLGWGGIRVTG